MELNPRFRMLAGAMAVTAMACQQPSVAPAFEVASVKPSAMNSRSIGMGFFTYPGGRVVGSMVKLDYLIQIAFNLQPFQLEGGPGWIHTDRFDLEARPPAGSRSSRANPADSKLPPNEEQRAMLQALLEDRFQLRFHRETREGPVYVMTRNGKPLGLRQAADPNAYPWVGSVAGAAIARDGLKARNASMLLLTERIGVYLERPVIDRTELPGAYDFEFALPPGEPAPDTVTDIIDSLRALGLKLDSAKAPVEKFLIDGASKPAAN